MDTQIYYKTTECKGISGYIIWAVTPISYVLAPDKKASHDAHLTNKFRYERNQFDYSC